jgi:hypothetical protein
MKEAERTAERKIKLEKKKRQTEKESLFLKEINLIGMFSVYFYLTLHV